MGLNIDQILKSLEKGNEEIEKTAEDKSAEAIVQDSTETISPEEQEKYASEMKQMGQIMARAFMDELQKTGVGPEVMTTDPDAIPKINPAVELAQTEMPAEEPDLQQVVQTINALRANTMVGAREHGQKGTVVGGGHKVEPTADAAPPVVYDQLKAQQGSGAVDKTASTQIVGALYNTYFGTEE